MMPARLLECSDVIDLPLPPAEYRHLVGPTDPKAFDDPNARLNFDRLPPRTFASIFDFGCGCGRLARQFILNGTIPSRYLGIDPHKGMIDWCRDNLTSRAPQFEFRHHDVFQEFMNPDGRCEQLPLPAHDSSVTLFLAWSVFTHLLPLDAEYYLRELSRVLSPDGVAVTTWFLFDKREFPMMQPFQNALYISDFDPTNAVIFDRAWMMRTAEAAGLVVSRAVPPEVRGYHWVIHFERHAPGRASVSLPIDEAPRGVA